MKIFSQAMAMIMLALLSATVSADDAAIKKTLSSFIPDTKVEYIKPSEIPGLYEVSVGASIYYVSEDGKYLMQGQMIDAVAKKNITESKLSQVRKLALDRVGVDKMIVFKPENSKHQVSVFTDIDCGYCRKLHSEMDQYMDQGITIRYLFFPRAGKGSDSYKKAISVWCASDRQKALTTAKKGEALEAKNCDNPVNEHMQLGEDFGMNGTPMIITEKGNLLPGYVPAKQLATILNKE